MEAQTFSSLFYAVVLISGAITSLSSASTAVSAPPPDPLEPATAAPSPWTSPSPPSPPAKPPCQAAAPSPFSVRRRSGGIKGGYWPSSLAQTVPPSSIPTSYFTHVFYAFVQPDPTSYQLSITRPDEQWMPNFTATLHAADPPARAFLSIGGGGSNSETFSNMVSNRDNRAAFINSAVVAARNYGFDGLDLDWEFPNSPQDMINLATLFSEWRTAINSESIASGEPRILLSAAVYFASSFFLSGLPRHYSSESIRKHVDFVSPMCFDYHGAWDTSVTGEHALLFDKSSNISTSYGISTWKGSGMPGKKLVMGMPEYGRTWKLKDPNINGIGAPAVATGPGTEGVMAYTDIVDFNWGRTATVVYSSETVSTFSYSGTDWIGYDDPISIRNKVIYAKAQGLGGYFFWAIGNDRNWTLARTASMAWDGKK